MDQKTGDTASPLPKIVFWDTAAPQVKFINDGDFHRGELLDGLGLRSHLDLFRSFGTYDPEEIKRRQRLLRMFIKHPTIRNTAIDLNLRSFQVPQDEERFLREFPLEGEHNPFWKMVLSLTGQIRNCYKSSPKSCPPEVSQFCETIEGVRQQAKEIERKFAAKLGAEIVKSARLAGMVRLQREYSGDWKLLSSQGGGYQMYSYLLADWHDWKLPEWTQKKACRLSGLRLAMETAISFLNGRRKKRRYNACAINNVPESIRNAILYFANSTLKQAPKSGGNLSTEWIAVSFSYDGQGLSLWLTDAYGNYRREDSEQEPYHFKDISGFQGFSAWKRRKMMHVFAQAHRFFTSVLPAFEFKAKFWEFTRSAKPGLLSPNGYRLESQTVDAEFKWYSVQALCETSCAEQHQEVTQTRAAIGDYLKQLQEIALVAQSLADRSSRWGLPLTFPKIMDDDTHLISFNSLAPIHLIGKIPKDQPLVSVGPICLNGQMLGFTGQNAGGKTVTMETIINMLFMALSGLPVFGANVKLNPKKTIGLMFLERGAGSTFQLQLQKARRILEAAQSIEPNAMVLFLDEVGTGTAQFSGLDFGRRLLQSLEKSKPSVVFSTQIPELAHFAESIGAKCYAFDLEHGVRPGIGESGAEELIRREGLETLLTQPRR